MSIVMASIAAAIVGIAIRNIIGYLNTPEGEGFDIRKALASGIIGFVVGIPVIVTAFSSLLEGVEEISEAAQLTGFVVQVIAIAGLDAVAKGGLKARSTNN